MPLSSTRNYAQGEGKFLVIVSGQPPAGLLVLLRSKDCSHKVNPGERTRHSQSSCGAPVAVLTRTSEIHHRFAFATSI
jgi:hypothetical protein